MIMRESSILKKPKIEVEETEDENEEGAMDEQNRNEQREALIALIEHRTKEVKHLRQRVTYYKSQLDEAEKRLQDSENKLVCHLGKDMTTMSKTSKNCKKEVKVERLTNSSCVDGDTPQSLAHDPMKLAGDDCKLAPKSACPLHRNGNSSEKHIHSKPLLVIPSVNPNVSQPVKREESENKVVIGLDSMLSASLPSSSKQKVDKSRKLSSEKENVDAHPKRSKLELEKKQHKDLIPLISSSSSPLSVRCQTGCLLSSQHRRKLRSVVLCPTNDQLFVTSALDGAVNLWQVQGRGSGASLLSSTDCQSDKQRRWPEDIAWHPQGNRLFLVYAADGGDSQLSILNLNKGKERTRVSFLEAKPHVKGIINNIIFMPWDETCFVTGGSDHAVVLWSEHNEEDIWKPKPLHRGFHSSAVMGVAGIQHKKVVMSVGSDKRIVGFDMTTGRADYRHQIENKCMSILTNPCDFNLFMIQTGTPEQQLKLFDLRVRQMEIHEFGWKQESSESQSALINQSWSPDGLYITSGSADPIIHIFDIRYNAHKPSQSIRAHQKRVFKAAWHHNLPLLISISSDLNIGLHKIL